jgi:hypothetical protein
MRPALASVLAGLLSLAACSTAPPAVADPAAHQREVEKWRAERVARLTAPDGWLSLVGLFWIEEGESRVGANPDFEVPLPKGLPARAGTITLTKGKAHFRPAAGVDLKETDLHPDTVAGYEVLTLGTVSFYLIERGGRFGIRVKDTESPARKRFAGLEWYPVAPSWKVRARFIPSPHHVTFQTEVGVTEEGESPGFVEFQHEGQTVRLEPTQEGDELFFVIRDATSGKTTYGASRFLYTGLPQNGDVEIDFNKAYNPPCVFTAYATCPLPPPQNRMRFPIEAGEKMYRGAL